MDCMLIAESTLFSILDKSSQVGPLVIVIRFKCVSNLHGGHTGHPSAQIIRFEI